MTEESYRVASTEGLPPVEPHRDRSEHTSEIDGRKSAESHVLENILARPLAGMVLGWLQIRIRAESEFLHPLHLDLAESANAFTVHAEVPGFSAKVLELGVEPHRLTISGKREISEEHTSKKTIYKEQCSNQIYRAIDLPAEVDTSKVTARLKNGVLELSMPKAAKAEKVQITEKAA